MSELDRRELVSVEQAAEYLGVSIKTIRRSIEAGELKAHRVRGKRIIRLDMADVDALLKPLNPAEGVS